MGIKIKDPTLVYDFDYIIYAAGFAGEKRTIEVEHPEYDEVLKFANRTEMWGRGKKIGGWLETENRERESKGKEPLVKEDFLITDVQSAEPIANVLHTVKMMVEAPAELLGAKEIVGFLGGKEVPLWRWERSTLLEYKGNRKDVLSPIYKQEIINYLKRKYGAIEVNNGHEADDMVVMKAYKSPDTSIVVGCDKDILGNSVKSYNPNKPNEGIVDGSCFGEIHWDNKKSEARGWGRKFFYWQWSHGDDVDNYKSNCFSDTKWGKKSAFDTLKDCATDVECFEAVRDVYKLMYPEPKEVIGWRGEPIFIDWLYVANEIWDMARMKRWEGDNVTAEEVFKKYKLI